jgi:hypothetical protein
MRSLGASMRRINGPWRDDGTLTTQKAAAYLGMSVPFSVCDLMDRLDALPLSMTWKVQVTMSGGFALGGNVSLTVANDGSVRFRGAMHDSGFDSYSFRITAVLRSADASAVIGVSHSGSVGGTIGGGSRDHRWDELDLSGNANINDARRKLIQARWPSLVDSTLTVTTFAEDDGVGGSMVSVLEGVAAFVIAAVVLGPAVAVTLVVGAVIGDSLDTGGGFGELVGLVVIGGGMFLVANGIFLPVIPAALAAWGASDAIVTHRKLRADEEAFAWPVFHGTLPPRDKVILTNLATLGGRAFTWPNVDRSILLNFTKDDAYNHPKTYQKNADDPPGRLLIHELTHAWQMHLSGFMPMTICDGITGHVVTEPIDGKTAFYNPGLPGLRWDKYNMEQQAVIVARWFTGGIPYPGHPKCDPMSEESPWFRYIAENIWLGKL